MEMLESLAKFFAVASTIATVLFIASYVCTAIGCHKIAKDKGLDSKAILAWIPIANYYLLGLLVGHIEIFGRKIENAPVALLVMCLILGPISLIPFIGQVLVLLFMIITIKVNMDIMEEYIGRSVWLGIFSPVGYMMVASAIKNKGRN